MGVGGMVVVGGKERGGGGGRDERADSVGVWTSQDCFEERVPGSFPYEPRLKG